MNPLHSLLSTFSRLAARRPRGSVLIIVIVLLLLLAILGTSYLSTTRSARVTSAQNVMSGDVDTMMEGIEKTCEGVIIDDLNDTNGNLHGNTGYTPTTPPAVPVINHNMYQGQAVGQTGAPSITPSLNGYNIGDIVNTVDVPNLFYTYTNATSGTAVPVATAVTGGFNGAPAANWQLLNGHLPFTAVGSDPWLADRIPDPMGDGTPTWNGITQLISTSTAATPTAVSILGTQFEDPTTGMMPAAISGAPSPLVGDPNPLAPSGKPLTPTYMPTTNFPAFSYGGGTAFVAADADGDGVADSLYFRVPGANIGGLTWYAAVRIVDNNAAINANSAWSRDIDNMSTGAAANIWALFQTSVGLQESINTSDNINTLNNYRFNGLTAAQTTAYDESLTNGNWTPPPGPAAYARTDFNFISQSDAFYNEFIRRMANPGLTVAPTSGQPLAGRYQAIPLADEASLAYHFGLINQETLSSGVSPSILEGLLPFSFDYYAVNKYYRSTPYGGNPSTDIAAWFNDNFQYGTAAGDYAGSQQPLRQLLVTHNPVSNAVAQVYNNNDNSVAYLINNYSEGKAYTSDPILPNYMLPYSGQNDPHFKGLWNTGTAYQQNDIVVYPGPAQGGAPWNGPSYTFIALNPNTGVAPSTPDPVNHTLTSPTAAQAADWQLQPWTQTPVKTNVNTATFRELFRAFWCVMAGNPSNATPFGYTADPAAGVYDNSSASPQHMFRSPLRDPNSGTPGTASELDGPASTQPSNPNTGTPTNTNTNTMLVRAALAAVNTLGLRDNSQNIISKTFILKNAWVLGGTTGSGTAVPADVEVRVYSSAPQPVISEVYVNTNTGGASPNPAGYVAVELFNPYPVPIYLNNWTLAYINRQTKANTGTYPNLQFKAIGVLTPAVTIYPSGYVLLENYDATPAVTPAEPGAAVNRPTDTGMSPTGVWTGPTTAGTTTQPSITGAQMYQDVYVPYLEDVIQNAPTPVVVGQPTVVSTGGELVLLRPHRLDGTLVTYTDPANINGNAAGSESFNEGTAAAPNPYDMVPVDSYDFTGLSVPAAGATSYQVWSYIRAKGNMGPGNQYLFKTTYPGQYNAMASPRETATYPQLLLNAQTPTYAPVGQTSASLGPAPLFGQPSSGNGSYLVNNFPPIQVYNLGAIQSGIHYFSQHFPNAITRPNTATGASGGLASANLHPFGGFARNGDMLDIPFIGAYRVRVVDSTDTLLPYGATSFLEMNSLPMDCSLAAIEFNSAQDAAENIGRFVPMAAHTQGYTGPDYYSWTRRIFDYLTVQSPTDTYLPNFDPGLWTSWNYSVASPPASLYIYSPADNAPSYPPTPVMTGNATATDQTKQGDVGVEGLININTASWKVLSMLPFVPSTVAGAASLDQQIAKAIVLYRDGDLANKPHGPFASIFDLNQVPGFQNGAGAYTIGAGTCTASSAFGLMSPADISFGTTAPNTANPLQGNEDYQSDCLTLTRISNLVTTRSDSFTIYVEVQGWQNAGTANAQPMVTRRYAFIVDRSAVNADPSSRYLKTLTVPND
jgi:hypothetical protein